MPKDEVGVLGPINWECCEKCVHEIDEECEKIAKYGGIDIDVYLGDFVICLDFKEV